MNSSKVAVRGATLLVVVPSRGWSGFTSAADLLAVRESMNVCLTSGLTIRMDASTTFCGHIPITPRFWGVGHLRPLPPATDHATKCSRAIVSELIGSVNTSAFSGTNPEILLPVCPPTCQNELRFLLSAGRRSAHFRMASSVGQRDWPHGVKQYSAFGGT